MAEGFAGSVGVGVNGGGAFVAPLCSNNCRGTMRTIVGKRPIPVVAKTKSRVKMENWKSIIIANDSSAQFSPALNEAEIVDAEKALAVDFPSDLRDFFLQSDGVTADYGSGVVWMLSDVVSRNLEFRGEAEFHELYMPFDHLLFFGDDGGGDQFALSIHADGVIHKYDIYRWEHETDARSWFASDLRQYLAKRLDR